MSFTRGLGFRANDHRGRRAQQSVGIFSTQTEMEGRTFFSPPIDANLRSDLFGDRFDFGVGLGLRFA